MQKKLISCLFPYDMEPTVTREYNRQTVTLLETLCAQGKCGFAIHRITLDNFLIHCIYDNIISCIFVLEHKLLLGRCSILKYCIINKVTKST